MQKIASHIKNPAKFAKASKLAVQLVQAGSVREGTSDLFFSILDAAMISSPGVCSNPSLRADYQELFSAAQNVKEVFVLFISLMYHPGCHCKCSHDQIAISYACIFYAVS